MGCCNNFGGRSCGLDNMAAEKFVWGCGGGGLFERVMLVR